MCIVCKHKALNTKNHSSKCFFSATFFYKNIIFLKCIFKYERVSYESCLVILICISSSHPLQIAFSIVSHCSQNTILNCSKAQAMGIMLCEQWGLKIPNLTYSIVVAAIIVGSYSPQMNTTPIAKIFFGQGIWNVSFQ